MTTVSFYLRASSLDLWLVPGLPCESLIQCLVQSQADWSQLEILYAVLLFSQLKVQMAHSSSC